MCSSDLDGVRDDELLLGLKRDLRRSRGDDGGCSYLRCSSWFGEVEPESAGVEELGGGLCGRIVILLI